MTRDALVDLLRARDALTAAADLPTPRTVDVVRGGDSGDLLVDGDTEGAVDSHRAAHIGGRATVATILYGEGVPAEATADRMLALAALAAETGMLRAVTLLPAPGVTTPGSWGVEDLTVVAAARRVFGDDVRVRASWERLGPQTVGVALAFGADQVLVPDDARVDVAALAAAVGREVSAR